MTKIKNMMFVFAVAFCFVLGTAVSSQATVTLTADAAQATYPAERTQKIGAGNDGIVGLVDANITWQAGANYVQNNILRFTIDPAKLLKMQSSIRFIGSGAGSWTETITNAGGYTVSIQVPTAVPQADTLYIRGGGSAAISVNCASVVAVGSINAWGVMVSAGAVILDNYGTDVIARTVTQYAASNPGVAQSTIDMIGANGIRFVSGNTIGVAHTFKILSTNLFAGTPANAPTFAAGDSLVLTLQGANAFQGIAQARFNASGGATVIAIPAGATNIGTFTFSQAVLAGLITSAGLNNVDLNLVVSLEANGTTELKDRVVSITPKLILNGTGNGTVLDVAAYGNAFRWDQNGAIFRCNYFRYDDASSQAIFYKFSNTAGVALNVKLRYYANDATVQPDWRDYDATVPAYGVLAINKVDVDRIWGLGAGNYNGWIEFQFDTGVGNVSGLVNAKYNDQWFNVPMALWNDQATSYWAQ